MEEAAERAATEEQRREVTQTDLQDRFRLDLEREKLVTSQQDTRFKHKKTPKKQTS